jgi:hypothetical protein
MGLSMVSVATIGITMAVNGGQGHIEDRGLRIEDRRLLDGELPDRAKC